MGAHRHGQGGGHLPPRNVVKCFVHWQLQSNAQLDHLFMHYFNNFWRVGRSHLVVWPVF